MTTTTTTAHKRGFQMKRTRNNFKILEYTFAKQLQKGAVLWGGGETGCTKGLETRFWRVSLHSRQKKLRTKTRRTKITRKKKRYKNRGFKIPLATTSSCSTVFLWNGFSVISNWLWIINEPLSRPQPQNHFLTRINYKNRYFRGIHRQTRMTKIVSKPCVRKRSAVACESDPPMLRIILCVCIYICI